MIARQWHAIAIVQGDQSIGADKTGHRHTLNQQVERIGDDFAEAPREIVW
jgi:hypothetical protein